MTRELDMQKLIDNMYNRLKNSDNMTDDIEKSYKEINKNYHKSVLKELDCCIYNHSMEVRRHEAI